MPKEQLKTLAKEFCDDEGLEGGQWVTFIDDHMQAEKLRDFMAKFLQSMIDKGEVIETMRASRLIATVGQLEVENLRLRKEAVSSAGKELKTIDEIKFKVAKMFGFKAFENAYNYIPDQIEHPLLKMVDKAIEMYANQFKSPPAGKEVKPLSSISDEDIIQVARLAHQLPNKEFKVRWSKEIVYAETEFDNVGIKYFISMLVKYGTVCAQICFSKTDKHDYKQHTVNIGQISISSERPVPYIAIVDYLRSKSYDIPVYYDQFKSSPASTGYASEWVKDYFWGKSPTSTVKVISDEEIESFAEKTVDFLEVQWNNNPQYAIDYKDGYGGGLVDGAKWYRDQLNDNS